MGGADYSRPVLSSTMMQAREQSDSLQSKLLIALQASAKRRNRSLKPSSVDKRQIQPMIQQTGSLSKNGCSRIRWWEMLSWPMIMLAAARLHCQAPSQLLSQQRR